MTAFALADLPHHIEIFGFVLGVKKAQHQGSGPGQYPGIRYGWNRLHDALIESEYAGHDLGNRFLNRIPCCACSSDDTGIFELRDIFLSDFVHTRTRMNMSRTWAYGSHCSFKLSRVRLRTYSRGLWTMPLASSFRTVNGDLFRGPFSNNPDFDAPMRQALLNACRFDWTSDVLRRCVRSAGLICHGPRLFAARRARTASPSRTS